MVHASFDGCILPRGSDPAAHLKFDQRSNALEIVRYKDRKALKFTTASGIAAIVASSVNPILMKALKRKLERKLRKSGHLPVCGK